MAVVRRTERACRLGAGSASAARGVDHALASDERQDRRIDPGAAIGKGIVGGDLGAAAGSARTARAGGAATKDDAPGDTGKEPTARGVATSSPETARWESVCEDEQWLVAGA